MNKNGLRDMTTGSPAGHILYFALPLLVGSLLQQFYNMVDSWVVGQYVGDAALAAVGVGFPVLTMFSSLFIGLSNGGTVIIAQFFGAGKLDRVREAVEPYGTKISLRVESEALEHTELSGLSASLLDRFAYRFWTGAEGQAALAGMAEIENAGERTVEIVTQAAEDRERFQAVLSEKG